MHDPDEKQENDVYARYNAFKPFKNPLKKYPCQECFNCLFCSEARCQICRNKQNCKNEAHEDGKCDNSINTNQDEKKENPE